MHDYQDHPLKSSRKRMICLLLNLISKNCIHAIVLNGMAMQHV